MSKEEEVSHIAEYLDELSWQVLSKAVQHKDKELIEIFLKLQRCIDHVVFKLGAAEKGAPEAVE